MTRDTYFPPRGIVGQAHTFKLLQFATVFFFLRQLNEIKTLFR